MARRIEILDTTLRDGNKLPFVVLSLKDRIALGLQLSALGVDVVEAGFPASSAEEAECVTRMCRELDGPYVSALSRALPGEVARTLEIVKAARKPHIHIFMPVSPHFLAQVLKKSETEALASIRECVSAAKESGVRVQFSLSQAPHARAGFREDAVSAAREAGAEVITLADTNGVLTPEDTAAMVASALGRLAGQGLASPVVGVHCHDDFGLATANTLAAILAGASHVEVTIGGFGERAGNAALEEIALLIAAFGDRYSITHGIRLGEIARTSRLFDAMTGIRTHPNKAVIGQCAFAPVAGSESHAALPPSLRDLLQEKTIGGNRHEEPEAPAEEEGQAYALESFNVLTGSHSPPVGVVVIRKNGGSRLTRTSHGTGPIDALFRAVDRAVGFTPVLSLYSLATLSTGKDAPADVTVTVEFKGRRFHGHDRSTDVINASIRAYLKACNSVAASGLLESSADFYVHGENLWE